MPVPPEVTCEQVASCVKTDLQFLVGDAPNQIDNFCDAAVKCVNNGLEKIPLGLPSGLDNFDQAVFAILKILPGYTTSGAIKLVAINGTIQWVEDGSVIL